MSTADELRRLLDERGVDYIENDFGITWSYYSDPHTATESMDGTLIVTGLTPAQAIAATLGADASPTQAESSGTLTAEKVRELMEENSRQYQSPTDPYVWLTEYDWQAIADELNTTLGRGTCHIDYHFGEWYCTGCGEMVGTCDETSELRIDGNAIELWHFCPNCGRKVVEG